MAALRYYEALQAALAVAQDEPGELAIYTEGLARQFVDINPSPEIFTDFTNLRA